MFSATQTNQKPNNRKKKKNVTKNQSFELFLLCSIFFSQFCETPRREKMDKANFKKEEYKSVPTKTLLGNKLCIVLWRSDLKMNFWKHQKGCYAFCVIPRANISSPVMIIVYECCMFMI